MSDKQKPSRKSGWSWLLWWKIDETELAKQVNEYGSLGFFRSARKLSLLLLLFSSAITFAFIYYGIVDEIFYAEIAVFVAIGVFIFFGHRWAMIGAMIVWTVEKIFAIFGGLSGASPNGGNIVTQVIWWAAYMHAFYLAFRVEQERRHPAGQP